MLVRDGTRVMTCPTCRQPELERTKDSMQRELNKYYAKSQSQVSIEQLSELVQIAFSRMTTSDQAQLLREVQGPLSIPVQVIQVGGAELAQMARASQAEEIARMAFPIPTSARTGRTLTYQRRAEARAEVTHQTQAQAPTPTRPAQFYCSSGRDCHSRSRTHNRTKTHLKCRNCNLIPCCMNCKTCVTCV